MIISLDAKEKIWHNPTFLNDKISGASRDTGNISPHNKGNIYQANSQQHSKWKKIKYIFTNFKKKSVLPEIGLVIH